MRAISALATAGLLTSGAAGAAVITFGSGQTTTQTTTSNGVTSAVPTETFGSPRSLSDRDKTHQTDTGCGPDQAFGITSGPGFTGGFSYSSDSVRGRRLNPFAAVHCYLAVGSDVSGNAVSPNEPTVFGFNDSNFSEGDPANTPIRYLGFYWGSVDDYNYLSLQDGANNNVALPGDTNHDGVLSGTEIAALGGFSVNTAHNTFVNIFLAASDQAYQLTLGNTENYAFEIGNLAETAAPVDNAPAGSAASTAKAALLVPEPGAAVSLLAGMGLLGFARRKRG